MDPFKLVPAKDYPYIISVLSTALTGLAGWVMKRFWKISVEELQKAKDSLIKLQEEIVLQRTNHLSHIQENTEKTVTLLESMTKEQAETNGYLKAVVDLKKA